MACCSMGVNDIYFYFEELVFIGEVKETEM